MLRTFNITLPADTNPHNLYSLMLLETGAVPVDGILPKSVQELTVLSGAGTVKVADVLGKGKSYGPGDSMTKRSGSKNEIHIPDFYVTGAAGAEDIVVEMSAR